MAAPKGNCFNPKGPPKKEIDWKVFEEACSLMCTQDEMEGLLRVSRDTLLRRVKEQYGEDYAGVFKRFSSDCKRSLRRTQLKIAQKNTAMAIWLGKQLLGQRDIPAENQIAEDVASKFTALMLQLSSLQQATKADSSKETT